MTKTAIICVYQHPEQRKSKLGQPYFKPLIDRPFIQKVVEYLMESNFNKFHFLIEEQATKVETLFEDGSFSGLSATYHLVSGPESMMRRLKILAEASSDHQVLLGDAACLPDIKEFVYNFDADEMSNILLACRAEDLPEGEIWSGWAMLSKQLISEIPENISCSQLADWVSQSASQSSRKVSIPCLFARSYPELLKAQRRVLFKGFSLPLNFGSEIAPGIWVGDNVVLPKSAQLAAPLYLGEGTVVDAGAKLGPNTVIGPGCIVGSGASVSEALLIGQSYVKEGIAIYNSIVEEKLLLSLTHQAEVEVSDLFLAGDFSMLTATRLLFGAILRVIAVMLLILLFPIFLLVFAGLLLREGRYRLRSIATSCGGGGVEGDFGRTFRRYCFVRDECNTDSYPKQTTFSEHFSTVFYPGLLNLVRGDVALVGAPLRTAEEVARLSPDWKVICELTRPGLISEGLVRYWGLANADEDYTAEACYLATACWKTDLRILAQYLAGVLPPIKLSLSAASS